MADTLLAALTETSVPDTSDYTLWEDNTGPTSGKVSVPRLLGLLRRDACQGRLTLTTAVPVTTADVIGASTLYWTPIDSGLITLYDGTRWVGFFQAELSLALSGLTSGKNYDAFISYNAGTPALVLGPAWTNDTTRATGLTTQNGIKVLSGATTSRYVGTIRTTGTTTTEDSSGVAGTTQVGGKRFVWNAYNQVPRDLRVIDLTDSWTYATDTARVANGATAPLNCVEYVVGDAGVLVTADLLSTAKPQETSLAVATVGIGIDGTTYAGLAGFNFNAGVAAVFGPVAAAYQGYPGLGYHSVRWLERAVLAGTVTYYGDNGGTYSQSGLRVRLLG